MSFQADAREIDFDLLATYLKALASPVRLELLWRLRAPAGAADVALRPRRHDDLPSDRAVSRQTVSVHLERLEAVGVVSRVPDPEGGTDRWATSAPHLFALVEELRKITAVPASAHVDLDETRRRAGGDAAAWEPGAKLVLVTGPWEGRTFPLRGDGPWRLGRSRASDVALSFDPYVSAEHASLRRAGDALVVAVDARARNALGLNGGQVAPGASRPVRHGDVLTVGRSTLVLHEQ